MWAAPNKPPPELIMMFISSGVCSCDSAGVRPASEGGRYSRMSGKTRSTSWSVGLPSCVSYASLPVSRSSKAIEEFHARGVADVMEEACEIVGQSETYISYDIDFVDPTFAPGTGTPEIGGPNSYQAIQVVRALDKVNIIGADLVEVSPPFDQGGSTAFLGASIMFELLCVMVS